MLTTSLDDPSFRRNLKEVCADILKTLLKSNVALTTLGVSASAAAVLYWAVAIGGWEIDAANVYMAVDSWLKVPQCSKIELKLTGDVGVVVQ